MTRVLIAMTLAAASAAVGQILVRRGMQQVGSLENYAPSALLVYFAHAAVNLNVILGTVLNTVFYLLFLASLSWTEVTVVLPFTAIEYGFAAFLALIFLGEQIPPLRWAGIVLVILGVIFIARSGAET